MPIRLGAVCFFMILITIVESARAQSKLDKFLDNLTNDSLKYEVYIYGVTQIKNNKVIVPEIIADIESLNIEYLIHQFRKRTIIKKLVALLKDPNRDWYANALLYAITKTDATRLSVVKSREEWLEIYKSRDVEYWHKYLKRK